MVIISTHIPRLLHRTDDWGSCQELGRAQDSGQLAPGTITIEPKPGERQSGREGTEAPNE
jgi:hypothetical protein